MHNIHKGENCFYIGDSAEQAKTYIRWTPSGNNIMIVEETAVEEELRGSGVGKKLVDAVAKLAREENKRIIATCSYAKKILESKEKYQDLLQDWGSHY